jgi:hypothetical protein
VDLNDYETSKQRLAEIHQAEADAKREAEEQARKTEGNFGATCPKSLSFAKTSSAKG